MLILVGGFNIFNPFEKYESKWEYSPPSMSWIMKKSPYSLSFFLNVVTSLFMCPKIIYNSQEANVRCPRNWLSLKKNDNPFGLGKT